MVPGKLRVASCKTMIMCDFGFSHTRSSVPWSVGIAPTVGAVDTFCVMLFLLTHLLDSSIVFPHAILPTPFFEVAQQSKSTDATKYTRLSIFDWSSGMVVLE